MLTRTLRLGLFTSLFAVMLVPTPALGQASASTERFVFPIDETELNPCTGEDVALSGSFQVVVHITADASGGFHLAAEGNAKNVSGTGLDSGISYRATGGFWDEFNSSGAAQETFTSASVFNALSQGSASNLVLHGVFHFTIDANGNLTAFVDDVSFECLG